MFKTKISYALQNFVVFPILATNFLVSPVGAGGATALALFTSDENGSPVTEEIAPNPHLLTPEQADTAAKIDAYFAKYNMPLEGYGYKFVLEADKNGIDRYLAASIAVRESTGGKFACKSATVRGNAYGWGSCKSTIKGFSTFEEGIETISMHLGGNMEKTARYYKGKTIPQILNTYNPPSIVAEYTPQVMTIMKKMSAMEVQTNIAVAPIEVALNIK